jgi:hypothetical protein
MRRNEMNINYRVEEIDGVVILVNQNTNFHDYEVLSADFEKKLITATGFINKIKSISFQFNRIDNNEMLKEYFL